MIVRASRAAIVPIDTFVLVVAFGGSRVDRRRLQSFNASAVIAEQHSWGALAVVETCLWLIGAHLRDQVGRQPEVEFLVDEQLELAVHQVVTLATATFNESIARPMCPP
jgi:hypothetical protein